MHLSPQEKDKLLVVTAALPFGAAEVTNTLRVERVP